MNMNKLKSINSFTVLQKVTYVGMNLIKYIQNLSAEYCSMLKKKIKRSK